MNSKIGTMDTMEYLKGFKLWDSLSDREKESLEDDIKELEEEKE